MTKSFVLALLTLTMVAAPVLARQGGAGAGGQSGLPAGIDAPRTIPQQIASKLKLDRTQSPQVDQILTAAASEAGPHVQAMLQARQRLLNATRAYRPEEVKVAQEAYRTAAAQIAGIDASVLAKIFALLKPNQQKEATEAFALMAGLFANAPASGARGGARGGAFPFSRLESLEENFKLTGNQKKAVKTALDEAHKSAAPVRRALLETHAALGDAVQTGKSQDEIATAARGYAEQAAKMARIEMEAMAKVLEIADPELKNQAAIQAAFFMARGMFLKNNKWDEIPERNVPSY